ncbi:MAG: radical SAM protein [Alphaproteobacteria bacterium]|nr:radical SAM protein [Alphaproteobacteria bacterium]
MRRALSLFPLVYRSRRRRRSLPRLLTCIVTFTCNARCVMCDSWRKESADDLDVDEYADIFAQLPPMDAVRLTGGEPFVRRDLPRIARLVQERLRPFVLHVTTNGFLTRRIVQFCEQRDKTTPLQLLISVDGFGERHNEIRGQDTAWRRTTETLAALVPRREALRLRVAVNQTVVDPQGLEHYRRLRDWLAPMGVRNQVVLAYNASATYSTQSEQVVGSQIGRFKPYGDFTPAQLATLLDEVERDTANLPLPERIAKRYYLRGLRERLLGSEREPLNPPCAALSTHLRLFPNGDVPTCQFNTQIAGNLRRQRFAELWASDAAKAQRSWVNRCAGCWAECEVVPSAIYSGGILRGFTARRSPPAARGAPAPGTPGWSTG